MYAHIRHSVLYVLWALLYLYLVFIQQPILFFIIRTVDRLSNYWPFRGTRETIIAFLKLLLARVAPSLARHFLSYTPFGQYSGNDRELFPGEKKRFPLHSVSLNGCAWMLPYHIGVCEVLKTYGMVDENTIWLGSSGGALIATAAALDLDLEHQLKFCISMGIESGEAHTLGPVANMSRYIAPHIMTSLPDKAHMKVAGKLHISVTETPQASSIFGNKLVNEFKNERHIYHTLMASTYIPLYYERPVRPGIGAFYWDGGFSNNQPVLYGSDGRCLTTTVSPMARKADISPPRQTTCNVEHLFPGGYDEAMNVYFNGRRDALAYVRKMHDKFGFVLAKPLVGDENVRKV